MKRIRLTTGPTALFGAAFLIALIAFMPMRLVLGWFGLGETGLAARTVNGSVWWGSLSGAQFGDLDLGDLNARLSPVQLLVGRARVALDGRDASRPLRGAIGVSRHSMGLDDMTASLAAGNVFAPVPVSAINLDDVTVRFQDGTCQRAEGRVRATLNGDLAGIALTQGLSGTAKCDSGALLLPLASQSGTEAVALRLWATGRFRAELSVQPADPAAVPKLVLSGFQPGANGYTLAIEGRF
ncbi:MAG: type II secretion system protein N [Pseudomonadota bacterium]|uniref:type II secretion system protein N n=1 Tax=Sphingomonas sp. ERG5 TaxID=1381597 RepID=UPI00054BA912|nr:type II secretion system protein N [Sphingomonas sp. ERG5]